MLKLAIFWSAIKCLYTRLSFTSTVRKILILTPKWDPTSFVHLSRFPVQSSWISWTAAFLRCYISRWPIRTITNVRFCHFLFVFRTCHVPLWLSSPIISVVFPEASWLLVDKNSKLLLSSSFPAHKELLRCALPNSRIASRWAESVH